ncbi:MAG: AMP-binding protein, partial [Candidatus Limnocylindria bacterium]
MSEAPSDPIAAWAAADGGAPAVVEGARVTTRAELNAEVNRMANGLAALGVRSGERGVWCGPNSAEVVVSFRGSPPGFLSWEDLVALGSADEPPPAADYGTAMMYTSGTTGRPKGAIRSRSDRALLGAMMAELRFGSAEVHLVTGPLYHA